MRQRRGQIDRRRGFSDAAFLIRNRDDGRHLFLPPPAREKSSRSDPATGFLYMGAAFRKPPRPRLTLRLQPVHWQGKSGPIAGPRGGNQGAGRRANEWSLFGRTLNIQAPKTRRRLLEFQAEFPARAAFVAAPH